MSTVDQAVRAGARPDVGRLVVLPAAVVLAVAGAASLVRGATHADAAAGTGALRWLTALLSCCFYVLAGWCYLRRGRAVATRRSIPAHLAAVTATVTPFAFGVLPVTPAGAARSAMAAVLLLAGTAWSVWAVRSLGRSVGILAQARRVVHSGPYRWVRHPLYVGELIAAAGLALVAGTAVAAGLWLVLCGLQVYRAGHEEAVLAAALPDYVGYRARTAALLPGVF